MGESTRAPVGLAQEIAASTTHATTTSRTYLGSQLIGAKVVKSKGGGRVVAVELLDNVKATVTITFSGKHFRPVPSHQFLGASAGDHLLSVATGSTTKAGVHLPRSLAGAGRAGAPVTAARVDQELSRRERSVEGLGGRDRLAAQRSAASRAEMTGNVPLDLLSCGTAQRMTAPRPFARTYRPFSVADCGSS